MPRKKIIDLLVEGLLAVEQPIKVTIEHSQCHWPALRVHRRRCWTLRVESIIWWRR
jgi:hypothetical protein